MAETLFHILLPAEWQKNPITPNIAPLGITPNTLNSSDENHSFSPASSVATAPASSQPESTLQDPPIGPQAITNLTTVESNTIEPTSHNSSTPVSMAIGIEPNDISTWSVLQKRMSLDCQFMQPAEIPAAFIGNNSRQTSTLNTQKQSFNSDSPDSRPNTITQSKIEQIVDQKISSLKVYVLESDITEAQKAVKSVVELASF